MPDSGSPAGEPPAGALTAADDRFSTLGGGDQVLAVPAPGVLANDRVGGQESGSLQAAIVDGPSHGSLDLRPDGSLEYAPDAGWLGSDRFTYRAKLGSVTSPEAEVVIDVAGRVNAAPSFTAGPDQQAKRRKKDHTEERRVERWATDISPGPAEEAGQAVVFLVSVVSGASVLAGTPTISPTGTLSYESSEESGNAVLEVRLQDDGGTANGGQDTSPPHTLVITVTR